jgi:hypothetical protein
MEHKARTQELNEKYLEFEVKFNDAERRIWEVAGNIHALVSEHWRADGIND